MSTTAASVPNSPVHLPADSSKSPSCPELNKKSMQLATSHSPLYALLTILIMKGWERFAARSSEIMPWIAVLG